MKNEIVKKCFSGLILCLFAINFCYGDSAGFKKYESYIDKEQEVIKNKGISYDMEFHKSEYLEKKQKELDELLKKTEGVEIYAKYLKNFTKMTTFFKKGNKEKRIQGTLITINDYDKKFSYEYDENSKKWLTSKIEYSIEKNKTNIEKDFFIKDISFIGYEKKFGYKCAVFKIVPTDDIVKAFSSEEFKLIDEKYSKVVSFKNYKRYIVDECGIFIGDVIDNIEFPSIVKNIKVGIDDSEVSLPKNAVVVSQEQHFSEVLKRTFKNNNELTDTTNKKILTTNNETKKEKTEKSIEKQSLKTQIKEELKTEIKDDIKAETKKVAKEEAKKILKGFLGF